MSEIGVDIQPRAMLFEIEVRNKSGLNEKKSTINGRATTATKVRLWLPNSRGEYSTKYKDKNFFLWQVVTAAIPAVHYS